jgi:tetratricopeptide (TPR) repeat protein
MPPKLQPEDEQLVATATALLNNRSYEDAKELLDARIAKGLTTADPNGVLLLARIAGLLIDIGSEGHIEAAIKDGLALHENNRERFNGLFTLASIEYNLGNAKSALAELRTPNHLVTPGLADHDLLLAAKNHYWVALKAHGQDDTFAHQLRTNLGNALRKSGRIIEALTAYDDVIAGDPSFVMAHFHRALSLLVLEHLSGTRTTSLLWQAANEYAIAAGAPDARPQIRAVATSMHAYVVKRLTKRGRVRTALLQHFPTMSRQ